MSNLPGSWAELLGRLACLLGGRTPCFELEAQEWVREAVRATWGVESLHELSRSERQIAFQKASGALLALADEVGDLAFLIGIRAVVGRCFARYFDGAALDGPPWRLDPTEVDRPPYSEWATRADFGGAQDAQEAPGGSGRARATPEPVRTGGAL